MVANLEIPKDRTELSPVPIRNHVSWVYNKTLLYTFGGQGRKDKLNNKIMFIELSSKNKWTTLETTGPSPAPRHLHAAVFTGNRLYVFGGLNKDQQHLNSNLYIFDMITHQWNVPFIPGSYPCSRYSHAMASIKNKIYIFGGVSHKGHYLNDLISFREDIGTTFSPGWEFLHPEGEVPTPRKGHTLCSYNGFLYIFGGSDGTNKNNDLYEYNEFRNSFRKIKVSGHIPEARENHAAAVVDSFMYIVGGKCKHDTILGDLYGLDFLTFRWYKWEGFSMPERSGHSLNVVQDKLFILGGESINEKDSKIVYAFNRNKLKRASIGAFSTDLFKHEAIKSDLKEKSIDIPRQNQFHEEHKESKNYELSKSLPRSSVAKLTSPMRRSNSTSGRIYDIDPKIQQEDMSSSIEEEVFVFEEPEEERKVVEDSKIPNKSPNGWEMETLVKGKMDHEIKDNRTEHHYNQQDLKEKLNHSKEKLTHILNAIIHYKERPNSEFILDEHNSNEFELSSNKNKKNPGFRPMYSELPSSTNLPKQYQKMKDSIGKNDSERHYLSQIQYSLENENEAPTPYFDDALSSLENEREERRRLEVELEAEVQKSLEVHRMWQIAQEQVQFLQSSLSKAHQCTQQWTRRAYNAEKELRTKRKEVDQLEKHVYILKEALRRQGKYYESLQQFGSFPESELEAASRPGMYQHDEPGQFQSHGRYHTK